MPSLPLFRALCGYFLYFCRCASRAPSQEALAATCCGDGPGAGWADFSAGVLVGGGAGIGARSMTMAAGGSWTVRGADQWSAMAIAMACTPSTTARLVP